MKLRKSAQIILATLAITSVNSATAGIINNGNFDEGFTDWNIATQNGGTTTVSGNTAYLTASSWIGQEVSWNENEAINFDWSFWAGDYLPFNDFASFKLFDVSGSLINETILSSVEMVGDYGQTGWQNFTHNFSQSGSGWFNVGVFNHGDTILDSELGLDNFAIVTEVPEPASLALLAIGIGGLAAARKKTKSQAITI